MRIKVTENLYALSHQIVEAIGGKIIGTTPLHFICNFSVINVDKSFLPKAKKLANDMCRVRNLPNPIIDDANECISIVSDVFFLKMERFGTKLYCSIGIESEHRGDYKEDDFKLDVEHFRSRVEKIDEPLLIFNIKRTDDTGDWDRYNSYVGAVVIHTSEERARQMHPGFDHASWYGADSDTWVEDLADVKVSLIGAVTNPDIDSPRVLMTDGVE